MESNRFKVRYVGENEANAPWAVWDTVKDELATCQGGLLMMYPSEAIAANMGNKANRGEVEVDL
jgi:hypothetical protein